MASDGLTGCCLRQRYRARLLGMKGLKADKPSAFHG